MPNGSAPAPQAQPGGQAQPEVTEEVEGVLQFEGKGNGYLRDAKRSYFRSRSTWRCCAGSSTGCTCRPASS